MDKNCVLVRVINWNKCTRCKTKAGEVYIKPTAYLGVCVEGCDKVIIINTINRFEGQLLEYVSKKLVIGDKNNPQFKEVKKKAE